VGISLGGASAAALDAARVVLMRDDLSLLAEGRRIAGLTVQTIRESLFWAFSYNIVAIPLAALGYLNPLWAALFMAFSDVVVIGNAIRLKRR
jgi:Cu+-exporting ATPase